MKTLVEKQLESHQATLIQLQREAQELEKRLNQTKANILVTSGAVQMCQLILAENAKQTAPAAPAAPPEA